MDTTQQNIWGVEHREKTKIALRIIILFESIMSLSVNAVVNKEMNGPAYLAKIVEVDYMIFRLRKKIFALTMSALIVGATIPLGGIQYAQGITVASTHTVAAEPIASKVLVDGEQKDFQAYTINGNNYFKLRDIAYILNGTKKSFSISWDSQKNAIDLETGKSYQPVGGELQVRSNPGLEQGVLSSSEVYLNGKIIALTAYTINENNYFKLRDLADVLDFGVTWDGASSTVRIDSNEQYVSEAEYIEPSIMGDSEFIDADGDVIYLHNNTAWVIFESDKIEYFPTWGEILDITRELVEEESKNTMLSEEDKEIAVQMITELLVTGSLKESVKTGLRPFVEQQVENAVEAIEQRYGSTNQVNQNQSGPKAAVELMKNIKKVKVLEHGGIGIITTDNTLLMPYEPPKYSFNFNYEAPPIGETEQERNQRLENDRKYRERIENHVEQFELMYKNQISKHGMDPSHPFGTAIFDQDVLNVIAGLDYIYILKTDGQLWGYGYFKYGAGSSKEQTNINEPTLVMTNVRDMHYSNSSLIVETNNDEIYIWDKRSESFELKKVHESEPYTGGNMTDMSGYKKIDSLPFFGTLFGLTYEGELKVIEHDNEEILLTNIDDFIMTNTQMILKQKDGTIWASSDRFSPYDFSISDFVRVCGIGTKCN